MALYIDGAEITGLVYVDGTEINNVYIDGTLVRSKPTTESGWVLNWSGTQYIGMSTEQIDELVNAYMSGYITDGMEETVEATSGNFSGVSNTSLNGVVQQADANYIEVGIYPNGTEVEAYTSTLTAPKNNNSKVSNLPWNSGSYVNGTLYEPTTNNSIIQQDADITWRAMMGNLVFSMFEVTALYYYKE